MHKHLFSNFTADVNISDSVVCIVVNILILLYFSCVICDKSVLNA